MKVFYSEKQVVDQGVQGFGYIKSPSAMKPKQLAKALESFPGIEFIEPNPVTRDDFKLCHAPEYVDGILDLEENNGFGNRSESVNQSLKYTNGAMYDAAVAATADSPTAALVAGFHHAGYSCWEGFGYFCTFNGLMLTAMKLVKSGRRVAIVDCDMHDGNGTDDILKHFGYPTEIFHASFGKSYISPLHAQRYLNSMAEGGELEKKLIKHKSDVILYQAGADVHVKDPFGGIFETDQIYERDRRMFVIAKKLQIPLAWDLAGGYQIEPDGSIGKVLEIHLNTFRACQEVYKN